MMHPQNIAECYSYSYTVSVWWGIHCLNIHCLIIREAYRVGRDIELYIVSKVLDNIGIIKSILFPQFGLGKSRVGN